MHTRVWNWAGECTETIKGHNGWVKRLQVAPILPSSLPLLLCLILGLLIGVSQYNEQILVTGSGDKTVKVWRWSDTSEAASTLIGHTDGIMGLRFMDHTIVSGSLDGTICVWDADTVLRFSLLFTLVVMH